MDVGRSPTRRRRADGASRPTTPCRRRSSSSSTRTAPASSPPAPSTSTRRRPRPGSGGRSGCAWIVDEARRCRGRSTCRRCSSVRLKGVAFRARRRELRRRLRLRRDQSAPGRRPAILGQRLCSQQDDKRRTRSPCCDGSPASSCLYGIGSILALVVGYQARRQIDESIRSVNAVAAWLSWASSSAGSASRIMAVVIVVVVMDAQLPGQQRRRIRTEWVWQRAVPRIGGASFRSRIGHRDRDRAVVRGLTSTAGDSPRRSAPIDRRRIVTLITCSARRSVSNRV